jgi:hypothetical protein
MSIEATGATGVKTVSRACRRTPMNVVLDAGKRAHLGECGMAIGITSAAAADDQPSIQLVIQMLLFALPGRQDLVLGNIGLSWLPMTDRGQPGRMRRQPVLWCRRLRGQSETKESNSRRNGRGKAHQKRGDIEPTTCVRGRGGIRIDRGGESGFNRGNRGGHGDTPLKDARDEHLWE